MKMENSSKNLRANPGTNAMKHLRKPLEKHPKTLKPPKPLATGGEGGAGRAGWEAKPPTAKTNEDIALITEALRRTWAVGGGGYIGLDFA